MSLRMRGYRACRSETAIEITDWIAADRVLLITRDDGRLPMAKGYWIARVDVKNEEGYKPYAAANPAIFKKYGGRFLVRGGKFDVAGR